MVVPRAAGAAAGTAVLSGAVVMLAALVSAPGPWTQGYVSEAGSAGQPLALAYRFGLGVLAVGVAVLGVALVRHVRLAAVLSAGAASVPAVGASSVPAAGASSVPAAGASSVPAAGASSVPAAGASSVPAAGAVRVARAATGRSARPGRLAGIRARPVVWSARLAAVLLAASAVLAGTSGAVPCSNQCPLPPFEPTTAADVIHTAASIAGMALLAAAMAAVALAGGLRPALRRLAVVALTATVPLGGALGLIMLFVGRGPTGAILERILLVVAVSWLVGTSGLAAFPVARETATATPGPTDSPPPRR